MSPRTKSSAVTRSIFNLDDRLSPMDPLSIASGAAGLAISCATIVKTLYTWMEDTVEVDENVSNLFEEVSILSRVLDSVSNASGRFPQAVVAEIDPGNALWGSISATLGDIKNTFNKLNQLMAELEKTNLFSRGFLRKPTKQIKFSLRSKNITIYKDRIKSYNTAMTSAFQMINVCLLIHSNSSQDSVFKALSGIKSQLRYVEVALHTSSSASPGPSSGREEDDRATQNLRQFVQVAENFHSSASTILREGPRSTVWGESIMGDHLTEAQASMIERWIPPPVNEEPRSPADADSDSETEGAIEHGESSSRPVSDITAMRVRLAYACIRQEKWAEADEIMSPIAFERKTNDILVYHGMHALALAYLDDSKLEEAEKVLQACSLGTLKPSVLRTQVHQHRIVIKIFVSINFMNIDGANTSVAYEVNDLKNPISELLREWPGAGFYSKSSVPTVIYYDQYNKVVGWGHDIANAIGPTGRPKPGVQKVEGLPLLLTQETEESIPLLGVPPGLNAVDVSADFLYEIRRALRTQLQQRLGSKFLENEQRIHWIVTTPEIWENKDHEPWKRVLQRAGYLRDENDTRLSFVSEAEASIHRAILTYSLSQETEKPFIFANLGKELVSMSSCVLLQESPFFATWLTISHNAGPTQIGQRFAEIVRTKIGHMRLPDGSRIARKVYGKCVSDFEGQFLEAGIKEGYMTYTNDEILSCFQPVMDDVTAMMAYIMDNSIESSNAIQGIILGGEFCISEYVLRELKLKLPEDLQRKVYPPMEPATQVVIGAANLGLIRYLTSGQQYAQS
ncbi:hypothetical protein FACUT_7766 [Fusarium acutatum]|uniref:Fungal N-terminal domain-containing protein n=1 Tax=Fusarium acutatum TaxID=78861 RepID=A0A8H4JL45_9HYPO|nr:hypothetical protein FACUT_7766 [Fusarium acutatum]